MQRPPSSSAPTTRVRPRTRWLPCSAQSDGWAAALVLGAHALRASGDGRDSLAALAAARQPVLDYLLHEVVEAQSPDLTQVLIATCQETEVGADEAALLSGIPGAAELLGRAAAAGLLVTAHRDGAGAPVRWRHHPLLIDLLRRRTAPSGPDWARVVEAHHRAAEEYIDRRDAERAVRHARLTGDLDLQLRVLREFSVDLISGQRTELVAEALAAIPLDIRSRHQELLVLQATVLRAQNRVDAAKAATDRALAAEPAASAPGCPATSRPSSPSSSSGRHGTAGARPDRRWPGPGASSAAGTTGEVSAHDLAGLPPLRATWLTLELASFEAWLGELELVAIHVQDAAMYSHRVDVPMLERSVLAHRAMLEMLTEAYQSALASADASLAIGAAFGADDDIAAARAHLVRGWSSLQELRLDRAKASLRAFDATPRDLLDPLLLVYGRLLRACVLTASGEVEAARRLLDGRGDVPELLPRILRARRRPRAAADRTRDG